MYMIKLLMELYGFYVLAIIVFLVFSSNDLFGCTDLQRISDILDSIFAEGDWFRDMVYYTRLESYSTSS
jgi:hypothetical protein